MYEYGDFYPFSCSSADFLGHVPEISLINAPLIFSSTEPPPPLPFVIPASVAGDEFDSAREALLALKSEVGNSSCCSSYGSPSSLPSCYVQRPSLIQRSMSSHSLQKDGFHHPFFSSREILDLETGPMRKVFSTGDIEGVNPVQYSCRSESPLSHENCIFEGTNKAVRYSAEERKEKIERYRSKRNQRNFNKKIKYACRKTLADSRPRIKGRFARNDEIGESSRVQWNQMGGDEDEEDDDGWINLLDSLSANLIP
ncbi:hypothetical protein HHK36_016506 [Tetracentron sinense]|uniref:CCT domain-containing protein n=1 Tax=Tetracentron sinense TaxID=13715 RepID=A0A834Z2W0_TETSI|nr:hypothetical protein HHK36_016506 [Tetracentron sinense]